MAIRYDQIELSSSSFHDKPTIQAKGGSSMVRINTNYGYIELGPENTTHCHIQTDRSNFYFNTEIRVNSGIIGSYDEDLDLRRAGTSKITAGVNNIYIKEGIRISENWGQGDYSAEQLTIIGSYPSITLRNNSQGHKWLMHHDGGSRLQFYEGNTWDNNSWTRRFAFRHTGDIEITKTSGTMIATGAGSDAFGYNADYGHYIAGNGGTYVYGNATYWDGSVARTIWHSGNDGSGSGLDADTVDGLQGSSLLRSDANDSYSGEITASGTGWYLWNLGPRGASAGNYGIGNRNDNAYRQLTFHVPNQAAYSSSGTIPSFGWYSNGAIQLMKLDSDSGNLWVKGQTGTNTPNGFRIDSSSYARIELDSNDNWSYIRLMDNGVTTWDIACYNSGNLEWRPGGGEANKMTLDNGGRLRSNEFWAQTSTNSSRFTGAGDWGVRHYTSSGYIQLGPANTGHAHIYTDRSNFYFNKLLQVNGVSTINTNDIRTKIYYDWDNTSYYCNPDSNSLFKQLICDTATSGWTAILGAGDTSRVHNDNARHGLVINASLYPHIDVNATATTDTNATHGAVISMTGKLGSGYRRWGMGIAQYNPNELSFGYYDNQTNPHYGVGINWSYPAKMWIDTGGHLYSTGSMRSPIFYDSNNTAYYADPTATSNFSRLDLQAYSFFNSGLQVKRNIGTTSPSWQDANHTLSLENSDAGYLSINFHRAGYTSNNIYYTGTEIITDDTFRSTVDMRAPIFYDSNNTAYYVNPDSTTSGLLRGNLRFNDYGAGITGYYTSTRIQTIFNMGSSYQIALDGSSVSGAYGLYWSHQNAGSLGGANNLASHGILIIENGSWKGAWGGGSLRTPGDARAPIFYDFNNTGYYVDAASTTNLNTVLMNAQTWRGTITWNSGVNINVNGECSIDMYSGQFGVWNSNTQTWSIRCPHEAQVEIGQAGNRGLKVFGTMTATADVVAYSDIRTKENVTTISNALDKVTNLRGVEYNRIGESDKKIGVIAQEIEKIIPEVITEGEDGMKAVAYGNIVGVLIEAIKEQQEQIEELKTLINKS